MAVPIYSSRERPLSAPWMINCAGAMALLKQSVCH